MVPLEGGEGYSPIKATGVLDVPFRVQICGLVPLRVLKPKMTAARDDTTLTRKGSEVIFIAIKISSASYIVLNWYLLGVEMNLPNAHKTRFWHLLGVFSKMPDEHPRHFIREYPPAWFTVHNAKNPAPEGQSSYLSRPYKQASFLTTRR